MHSGCAEKCLKRHFDHRRVDKKFRQGARASINGWEFKILRSKFFRIFFWWCCPSIPVGGFLCRSLEVLVGGIFVSVHLHVSHVTFFRTGGLIHLNESLQKINHTEKSLVEVWQISKFSSCSFQLEFWWDMNSTNKYIEKKYLLNKILNILVLKVNIFVGSIWIFHWSSFLYYYFNFLWNLKDLQLPKRS